MEMNECKDEMMKSLKCKERIHDIMNDDLIAADTSFWCWRIIINVANSIHSL